MSDRPGSAAQAVSLQARLVRFAEIDATVLGEARAELAHRVSEGAGAGRDFELGVALRRAPPEASGACSASRRCSTGASTSYGARR